MFEGAVRAMRVIDKMLWHGEFPAFEIQEEIDGLKETLDKAMEEYRSEMFPEESDG